MADVKELKDEQLAQVSGGVAFKDSAGWKYDGYNVVDFDWGCPCKKHNFDPPVTPTFMFGEVCGYCQYYKTLSTRINGWAGYCTWKKV